MAMNWNKNRLQKKITNQNADYAKQQASRRQTHAEWRAPQPTPQRKETKK